MDDLDLLLGELSQEAPPAESLGRVAPRVRAAIRRRQFTQWTLAAAAMIAAVLLALPEKQADIPLPEPVQAIIAVPDLILSSPAPAPLNLSRHRAKPKAIDETTI